MQVVGEAENGLQALELVERYQPDILVLDINMPVMTGVEVVQKLSKHKSSPKIIILSNYIEESLVEEFLEMGVHGYLVKEDAPLNLPKAIKQVYDGGKNWLSSAIMEKYAK